MAFENDELNKQEVSLANNSGQGKDTPVVDLVAKKFNWGAFAFSWIWGLCNKTYIPLLILIISFIPVVGGLASLGLCIWFGIKVIHGLGKINVGIVLSNFILYRRIGQLRVLYLWS